jgi:hypothetical protein
VLVDIVYFVNKKAALIKRRLLKYQALASELLNSSFSKNIDAAFLCKKSSKLLAGDSNRNISAEQFFKLRSRNFNKNGFTFALSYNFVGGWGFCDGGLFDFWFSHFVYSFSCGVAQSGLQTKKTSKFTKRQQKKLNCARFQRQNVDSWRVRSI